MSLGRPLRQAIRFCAGLGFFMALGGPAVSSAAIDTVLHVHVQQQTYRLRVSDSADTQSFRYSLLPTGILWVMPLPLAGSGGYHQGNTWDVYFTPYARSKHANINLTANAALVGRIPVRLSRTHYQEIIRMQSTDGFAVVQVGGFEVQAGEWPTKVYYVDTLVKNKSLREIGTVPPDQGGTFAKTLVSDGYFVCEELSPTSANVWMFDFAKQKKYTLPNHIMEHRSGLPRLRIQGHKLLYVYSPDDVETVNLP
ncbi:MAG: hypothetical protein K6T83_15025 [Alicyclobacillus sp.]|nr:hypothetical protein [Alicyclobacillus sp.]